MKMEKISDTQIRCTLNKEDLIDRELRLNELAYGTEKARELFRDMIQQAFYEFGFEVEEAPLIVEAIPISNETLVLLITKTEDPEELDTRFSKFSAPYDNFEDNFLLEYESTDFESDTISNDVLDYMEQIGDAIQDSKDFHNKTPQVEKNKVATIPPHPVRVFSFQTLDELIVLSHIVSPLYHGSNRLYKCPITLTYYLELHKSKHTPEDFNHICNIVSEYGQSTPITCATTFYFQEHFEVIIRDNALYKLTNL